MLRKPIVVFLSCLVLLAACEEPAPVISSTLIANAMIHSSSGSEPFHGAIRIDGDRIAEIGDFEALEGETVIDAGGLVLAPGFVAMQDSIALPVDVNKVWVSGVLVFDSGHVVVQDER